MKRITLFLFVAGLFSLFLTTDSSAQIFVKFDGINGEVRDKAHDNWTDFNSIEFGVAKEGGMNSGSTRQRSAAQMTEVSLTKAFDKSSIKLLEAVTIGQVFKKVEIHMVKNSSKGMVTYLTITLEDASLSSYNISSGGDRPEESVSVQFKKIKFEHTLSDGGKIPFQWDLEAGTK